MYKSKETSLTSYVAIHKLTRVIYKFIPTFGELTITCIKSKETSLTT